MVDPEQAGEALAGARRARLPLAELPGGLPAEEATAYLIQRSAVEALSQVRCGYKIGATSAEAQRILRTDHPFAAPLFEPDRLASGAALVEPGYGLLGLEPEFALRLGTDLPPGDRPYTAAGVAAAVASVHPAFEAIGLRLPQDLFRNALVAIADFGANVGLVAGDGTGDWQCYDLAGIEVIVRVEGEVVARGSGGNVMGHPLNALAWLANHVAASGGMLKAGDWVSTGTCAGVVAIARGQAASANFGPFGEVEVSLEG